MVLAGPGTPERHTAGRSGRRRALLHTQRMGDNTISNIRGKGSPATHWRGRFFALLIGLSIFGVLAWAVSGAIGQPKPIRAAGNVTAGGLHGAGAGTSGPAGGGSGGTGAAASPSPSATASPVPSSQA